MNRNWPRYLRDSEDAYRELENELTHSLKKEADLACHSMTNGEYRNDPWLWDLDWSVQPIKVKKPPKATKKKKAELFNPEVKTEFRTNDQNVDEEDDDSIELRQLEKQFQNLMATRSLLYKNSPFLPGYPAWYRTLCDRKLESLVEISTSSQVVPQLLKLTWDGYPLHHSRELGWGYLVPGRPLELSSKNVDSADDAAQFPLQQALKLFPPRASGNQDHSKITKGIISTEEAMRLLSVMDSSTADPVDIAALWQVVNNLNNNLFTCGSLNI